MTHSPDNSITPIQMVHEQLHQRGLTSTRLLQAMATIPRENFVSEDLRTAAYEDRALPIECEQTISQPYIVALMTNALQLTGQERILEIGTGSGYQTAILAELAAEVFTVEQHAALSQQARSRVFQLGFTNVRYAVGDGTRGWQDAAHLPFDHILIAAYAEVCPPAIWQQLAVGGRLVAPFGSTRQQVLNVRTKQPDGTATIEYLTPCRFVPLIHHRQPLQS